MRGESMQLRVLGTVELRCGVDPLPLSQLERALLARVAVGSGGSASVDALVSWIWGSQPPASARNRVQALVSGLRRKCDRPLLETTKSGYRLADGVGSDLAAWRESVTADAELAPEERWRALDTALGTFDEAPLQNIPGTDEVHLAQETLQAERLTVLEERGDLALRLGELRGLAPALTQLVQEHPFHEAFVAQLMRALAATGRQEEALRVYRDTYRRLGDELGVGPSEVLRAAHHDVLHGAATAPAPPTTDPDEPEAVAAQDLPIPRMLPRNPANFVGRDADVQSISRAASTALRAPVIVSITGTTGVGKSALAVHGGRLVQDAFPDGTLYADFGNREDGPAVAEVLGSFLRLLGLRGDAIPDDPAARVGLFRSILEQRQVLIVLDNVAEMTPEAASALELLVPVVAGSMAIVTSRTAHHQLPDAVPIRLRSLQIDDATALLAAMLGDQRVAADRDGAGALLDATGRLPLAIRLVAGRLVNRPDRQFGDMAHRLISMPRQDRDPLEGLRESVRMVWERRSPAEQDAIALLARLPVAGFSAWLPGALLGDEDRGDELIETMLATNLVEPVTTDDGMTLYRLHDLVTQFATSAHPVEDDTVTAATVSVGRALIRRAAAGHAVFHRRLVPSPPPLDDDASTPPPSTNPAAVRDFFRSDGSAMLTVADALIPTAPDVAWRLVLAAANAQHTFSGHRSWLGVATRVRAGLTASSADQQRGRALLQLAEAWHREDLRSQSREALTLAEAARKALTLLGETDGAAAADIVIAHAAVSLGRRGAAERALDRAEKLLRQHPDATYPGWACAIRGLLHNDYDELDAAEHELVRAREILANDGDRIAYATATIELARIGWRQHKLGPVNVLVTEVISLLQKYDEQHLLSYALDARAEMSFQLGRDQQALHEADVVWRRAVDSADDFLAARVRRTRARALAALDRLDEAETQLRASIEECTALDRPLSVAAAMHDLSAVLSAQGRHAAAAELRRQERAARASADLACREEFDEAYGREVGQDAGPAGG